MRVLVVGGYADSLINFRGNLLRDLVARGHRVHAAAPGLWPGSTIALQLEAIGVSPHHIAISRTGTVPGAEMAALWQMWRLMRRIQPDAVMGYTIKPVIWGMAAAQLARVPHRVALITGLGHAFGGGATLGRRLLRRFVEGLYRMALQRAHVTIFQNKDDLAQFRTKRILAPSADARIVDGSGVDLTQFRRSPLPPLPLRFVLIGRMIGAKGIREFAEAARKVRNKHGDVRFDLVGGLDTNPDKISEVELTRWQNEGILTWHGHVADVRPFLQAAHACVLPSNYPEGLPRSILEALATGRIVITTDTPGCRETVDPGQNGRLVPPRDADALAQAMTEIVTAPAERLYAMAEHSFQMARRRFDVLRVNVHMLDAIERCHPSGAEAMASAVTKGTEDRSTR